MRIKAEIDARYAGQTACKQARDDEQHHGNSDLRYHHNAAEALMHSGNCIAAFMNGFHYTMA